MGQEVFCPTSPDLPDTLGDTDFGFWDFHLFDCWDPTFLDFHVPRFPNSQISKGFHDFKPKAAARGLLQDAIRGRDPETLQEAISDGASSQQGPLRRI